MAPSVQHRAFAVAVLAACLVTVPARRLQQDDAGDTIAANDQYLTCATSTSEVGICTADLNPCGFPSFCTCPDGYEYDQRLGPKEGCLKTGVFSSVTFETMKGEPTDRTECALQVGTAAACTYDLTPCGYSSNCQCPQGYEYSPLAVKCLRKGV
mmetsp:Transcript_18820/g.52481  ORF Transcript_18820/g.52481 Transcript_18820/m.52481 type:complete len:154 (-) Transcript_18820:144-605(-)